MGGRIPLRELACYLRYRIIGGALARRVAAPTPAATLEETLTGPWDPIPLARLLVGRSNAEREAAVAAYLERRGLPFERHAFATFEGRGENFHVDVGSGDRVLVLVAHHDAVPGSPGANDNAVSVGILLHLIEMLARRPPARLRVRFLFPAAEEVGYLGTRAYVRHRSLAGIVGVLSLELCGIGDSVVIWDASAASPFLKRATGALEALGRRPDESYHVVGRIPVFSSDHRAFAAAGIPAYGLSIVPAREADALRRFVLSPVRSAFRAVVHRPPPFDTYHTPRDALSTVEPAACAAVVAALDRLIAELG